MIQRNAIGTLINTRREGIRNKAAGIWGLPKSFVQSVKYSDASTPEIRAAKLVAPYPPGKKAI